MRFFVCLLAPDGHGPSDTVRRRYESLPRGRDLDFAWHSSEGADVLTAWDDPYGDPLIVRNGDDIAVGVVRLDNRKEVQHWADVRGPGVTDLALVLHTVHRHGIKYIPHLLGDFAFVVWSGASRTAIAATDAFCIKRLFHAERDGLIAFASRAEALALEPRYDIEYLSERVSQCLRSEHLTVYTGVRKLPAGTFGVLERGRLSQRRYWSADDFAPEAFRPKLEREAPRRCRELFIDSVQHRLAGNDETWAQLSGGLDSSSIVSTAQWLAGKGDTSYRLAGTITYVDWQETDADEREYSDTVADRWHIRNEVIVDPPIWFDDHPPPPLDQPSDFLAFYPRERRLCGVVRGSGGRVLLAVRE
jgi:Asparagine synthase (glutamine-hydrolyzing)